MPRRKQHNDISGDPQGLVPGSAVLPAPESLLPAPPAHTGDLIGLLDADGRFLYASSSFRPLLGYDPTGLTGTGAVALVHPDDRGVVRTLWARAWSGGAAEAAFRMRQADGGWRRVTARAEVAAMPGGNLLLMVIREPPREADRELDQGRFDALLSSGASVSWSVNPDGGAELLSGWAALTGQRPQQMAGDGWADALHPDDRPQALRLWAEAQARRRVYEAEGRLRLRDGSYRLFGVRGVPLFDAGGELREWVISWVDIGDRKRAEDEHSALLARERAARADADTARRRQDALAEATRLFAEASLSVEATLRQVVRFAREQLGDCCAVRLVDDERLALPALLQEPEGSGPQIDSDLLGWVILSEQPLLVPDLPGGPGPHSLLAVPLRSHGRVIGAIGVGRSRPYGADDQTFLADLADRAVQALDRAMLYAIERRARAKAERSATQLARLQAITAALADALTPEQVARVVLAQCVQAFQASSGAFATVDPTGRLIEVIHSVAYPERSRERWTSLPLEPGLPLPDALLSRRALFFESPAQLHARYPQLAAAHTDDAAWVLVPFVGGEARSRGGLALAFPSPRAFDSDDRSFVQAVAQQCTQALERARLYAVEQQAADRLARLQRVTAALSRALTTDEVAEVIVAQGVSALGAQAGMVALLDEVAAELEIRAQTGYPVDELTGYQRFRLHDHLPLAEVARTGEAAWWEDGVAMADRYPLLRNFSPARETSAFACLPLRLDDRVIGVAALRFGPTRSFGPEERALMLTLAHQGAQALERARLHQAAEDAVRVRDMFFSIAAHELKSPLTALLGQAQLLRRRAGRDHSLDDRNARTLDTLIDQAQRMNRLVMALLDISRLEQGRLALESADLDLGDLVRRVVEETRPALERHQLVFEADGASLPVRGDPLRLEQVLQNLIGNAVKYSPDGGTVRVAARRAGEQVALSISDEGIGIPAAGLPRLFQRFYRASNVDARQITGMGIGLFVVRELVELHGGTVSVESTEGKGSTFTVHLPLHEVRMTIDDFPLDD
ncbi:MAG TPA: GAF domain-containing protein [Roseiflexaceae bacterium]|nr:GAF domain-containing protein [Roseiflexaceae bacterium]